MSDDLVLSLRGVNSGYRSGGLLKRGAYHQVLQDISFDIRHGEILGLVGESGSGKSTLARTILGLLEPESGTVTHYTKRPQMIFQDPYSSLNPAYSVEWILEEPLRIYGKYDAAERKRRVREMLRRVELPEEILTAKPEELSGGQRQRVGIARAVLGDPKILIFDEATSALDNVSERAVQSAMEALMKTHTVIVVAHRLSTIKNVDRILVFSHGQIVEEGTYDALAQKKGGYFHKMLNQ